MSKKDKASIETLEQPIEFSEHLPEIIVKFEDLLMVKLANGTIRIEKQLGGISDSTYSTLAVGNQKNWQLLDSNMSEIDTGKQHGNRPFYFEGALPSGNYTLMTGRDVKIYNKHRIPGRGYKLQFRI